MNDTPDAFRCDYCGEYAPIAAAVMFWSEADVLGDGRRLWLPAVYCSPYCGRTAVSRAGTGRG